jgi:uncharacterized phage protein (TIGR01671 family)
MREILFRGKRRDTKEWIKGCYIESVVANSPFAYITPSYPSELVSVYSKTVGQYSGKEDRNGVKMFEGDVVKSDYTATGNYERLYVVVFKDGAFGLSWTHNDVERFAPFTSIVDTVQHLVVGNIHDKPDLLKGGAE